MTSFRLEPVAYQGISTARCDYCQARVVIDGPTRRLRGWMALVATPRGRREWQVWWCSERCRARWHAERREELYTYYRQAENI